MRLSVVIPDYKDPLLHKTIDSLLDNSQLGEQLEVIAVCDGCWSEIPFRKDDRLIVVHLGKNSGMREAINAGVRIARGRYIMRTDEHCMFAKGYDRILTSQIKHEWIVTPRRYFLDPVKWERMDIPPIDYEKLVIQDNKKFAGQRWNERAIERANYSHDETMAMQGSCWIMKKKWWQEVIGELQTEGYGPSYQDSHDMIFKKWKK
jgi:glycosyltransferase involved in cell wall biosynthesis